MGKKVEPLTESYFYILLCLANGPNHGYGIMQRTKELSDRGSKDRIRHDVWGNRKYDKEGLDRRKQGQHRGF